MSKTVSREAAKTRRAESLRFDFPPTHSFRPGDHVEFEDHRGITRRTTVYALADAEIYGPDYVHVHSRWLSINFVTVSASRLRDFAASREPEEAEPRIKSGVTGEEA